MPADTSWEEWHPSWAPFVRGRYEVRTFDESGLPQQQRVEMHCEFCGGHWQLVCSSGNVRRHIATFAQPHAHRDALDAPRVVRPGSKRG